MDRGRRPPVVAADLAHGSAASGPGGLTGCPRRVHPRPSAPFLGNAISIAGSANASANVLRSVVGSGSPRMCSREVLQRPAGEQPPAQQRRPGTRPRAPGRRASAATPTRPRPHARLHLPGDEQRPRRGGTSRADGHRRQHAAPQGRGGAGPPPQAHNDRREHRKTTSTPSRPHARPRRMPAPACRRRGRSPGSRARSSSTGSGPRSPSPAPAAGDTARPRRGHRGDEEAVACGQAAARGRRGPGRRARSSTSQPAVRPTV